MLFFYRVLGESVREKLEEALRFFPPRDIVGGYLKIRAEQSKFVGKRSI